MGEPEKCSKLKNSDQENVKENDNRGSAADCEGRHQSASEPHYKAYKPRFTEAYVEYGSEFCLFEVGRRSRGWGMGIFLDNGRQPFADSASIFDGATAKLMR